MKSVNDSIDFPSRVSSYSKMFYVIPVFFPQKSCKKKWTWNTLKFGMTNNFQFRAKISMHRFTTSLLFLRSYLAFGHFHRSTIINRSDTGQYIQHFYHLLVHTFNGRCYSLISLFAFFPVLSFVMCIVVEDASDCCTTLL